MQGHTLGGGGGSPQPKMTPEQLRASRLAALDPHDNNNNNKQEVEVTAGTTVTFLEQQQDDDDDAELQQALAMSLQQQQEESSSPPIVVSTTTAAPASLASSSLDLVGTPPQPMNTSADINEKDEQIDDAKPAATESPLIVQKEPYDITAFHAIMWDSQTTTENDKLRWVGQGIHVVEDYNSSSQGEDTQSQPLQQSGSAQATTATTTAREASHSQYRSVLEELAASHAPWGLQQQHGGPCGVLAAVQAEVLRLLLWGPRTTTTTTTTTNNTSHYPGVDYPTSPQQVQPAAASPMLSVSALIRPALARAIALILARAALTPTDNGGDDNNNNNPPRKPIVRIVLPKEGNGGGGGGGGSSSSSHSNSLQWEDLEPWVTGGGTVVVSNRLQVYTLEEEMATAAKRQKRPHESTADVIKKVAHQVTDFLLAPREENHGIVPLDCFGNAGGVLLLVMSMVASRGATAIQEEFDDPVGTKLTAQFGHCSQELINLLLTGQAVSNVFDNSMHLGEAMVVRGITRRPVVGYLTQLEALRYCQVGGYYKSPLFPIWVVGSTSHFTVLFGDASSLEETESDKLLEKCRRAFKQVEGADENGFIPVDQLDGVLQSLELNLGDNVAALAAHLEVSGAGIILWDDFWKAASRLSTGATLASIVEGRMDDQPPPLIRAETPPPPSTLAPPPNETDEEMAKRLAAEWNEEAAPLRGIDFLGEAARAASPIPMDTSPAAAASTALPPGTPSEGLSSDEALARKLQAEWDFEVNGSVADGSHEAVGGSPARSDELMQLPPTPPRRSFPESEEEAKPSADRMVRFENPKLVFEEYGNSFALYHYNGLRGGTLTQFRVTRLGPEEAVGASIALNRGNASDGSGDLEDVVRTKWPSCMVDWGGKKPPYID